jgi:hypothetical protein
MTTILTPTESIQVNGTPEGSDLWLVPADLTRATGYELKPEGLCLEDVCVPVPAGRESEFVRDGSEGTLVNLAAFWRYLDAPIVAEERGNTWSIGEPPTDRSIRLDSLEAPDFTLPDAAGTLHSLGDYRGRKVLLAAWASW